MQMQHEQCFLCRRARPDKYVYYRDYNELLGSPCTMRFGSVAKGLAKCKLKYYRIS